MHVSKTAGEIARAESVQRAQATLALGASPDGASVADDSIVGGVVPPRSDAVHISDVGRALAVNATPTADAASAAGIDAARMSELRANVFAGAYNSLGMADQVARSIIRSGDL